MVDNEKIAEIFTKYCSEKKYQNTIKSDTNTIRLDISNLAERTIVNIFSTGTIQIQGKDNSLKKEMTNLKSRYEQDPQSFIQSIDVSEPKSCIQNYDIMLMALREKIKDSLPTISEANCEFTVTPSVIAEYRAKITRGKETITFTQYSNGTLTLQGKTNCLFNEVCDLIETIAHPSDKEVACRFISSDEKNLELFALKYTPRLIAVAENNVKTTIGSAYNYLEVHDQKWLVASECLCLVKIPLPEFSPLVMPAAKAFEGFCKKLLVGIGLCEADYFLSKSANFSPLSDENNPKRKNVCNKERHASTVLSKIKLSIDMNRNFMMHSDDSKITKVNSQQDAEEKIHNIYGDIKEIFVYFDDLYLLLPR